jgi:hypothetical protein
MTTLKELAHKYVDDFAACAPAGGAFVNIRREAVAAGLHVRIDDPYKIDQKGASLCGPAALVVELAKDEPTTYAEYVVALYENGEAHLGRLHVRAGTDLKNYALPTDGTAPDPADWIALASLRDSTNWILDYQEVGNQVAGITTPGNMAQWVRDLGYTKVIDKTFCPWDQKSKNLWEAAVRHEANGYKVFLLINAGMLDSDPKERSYGSPNHWVLLISAQITNEGDAKLQIYTWGDKRMVPPHGMLPAAVVRTYYFGFVAAKY